MPTGGAAPRPQRVADADRDILVYLIRIAGTLGELLGDALAGLYIHGSLASGTFRRSRSDLNVIGVVDQPLEAEEREMATRTLLRLSDARPVWGDLDVSIVQAKYARRYEAPMPLEVCYARERHEAIRMRRIDFSVPQTSHVLASSIIDLRNGGVTLVGPPPQNVFGPVPWHAFMASLAIYLQRAERIAEQDPATAVLAACRVLHGATARGVSLADKEWAASSALEDAPPEHQAIIMDSLALYRGVKASDDVVLDAGAVRRFIAYVKARTSAAFERANQSE